MPVCAEVELDIFSGMPNPTWILTNAEADSFVKQLAALPRTPARELSGNLGYRGFIVQVTKGLTRSDSIQNGNVHISRRVTNIYPHDEERELERWLLNTGKPHLKSDLVEIVEREVR